MVSIPTMSTTHHQVVWKCNGSEACEFTGENTLVRETLFSSAKAPVVEGGSLFQQVRGSMWEGCRQQAHRTVARARCAFQNRSTWDRIGALWGR